MASTDSRPNAVAFETVSGLTPDTRRLPFKISTQEVENYLKMRLQALQKKVEGDKCDLIDVSVYSSESSRIFVPFVVVLSMNASKEDTNKNRKGDAFFTTDRSGGNNVILKDYVHKFFEEYRFDQQDEYLFSSDNWRRTMSVSRETAATLKSVARPKIMRDRNGKILGIFFLLDPLRVFFDMLRSNTFTKSYCVRIESCNKQDATSFSYNVIRETDTKKKKGYGRSIIDEINFKMRGNK